MKAEDTFCLIKPETYIFNKQAYVEHRIKESGLIIVDTWKIKLKFHDIFRLYNNWFPRVTMSLRFYPFFNADLFILRGVDSIRRMHQLKHTIRSELGGFIIGGYLHAPDNLDEFQDNMKVLLERRH